jgi:hypothetical protein
VYKEETLTLTYSMVINAQLQDFEKTSDTNNGSDYENSLVTTCIVLLPDLTCTSQEQ